MVDEQRGSSSSVVIATGGFVGDEVGFSVDLDTVTAVLGGSVVAVVAGGAVVAEEDGGQV